MPKSCRLLNIDLENCIPTFKDYLCLIIHETNHCDITLDVKKYVMFLLTLNVCSSDFQFCFRFHEQSRWKAMKSSVVYHNSSRIMIISHRLLTFIGTLHVLKQFLLFQPIDLLS